MCEFCEEEVIELDAGTCCHRCGRPVGGSTCDCPSVPADVQASIGWAVFDGPVRRSIHLLKYHGEWGRAEWFAPGMVRAIAQFGELDGLVPVPLHRSKLRERGYNQSERLAARVSALTGLPVFDVLQRTRNTVSQTALDRHERRDNVRGAFTVREGVQLGKDLRLVVVDDVRTTGATTGECARVLKTLSPSAIFIVSAALEVNKRDVDEPGAVTRVR